MKFLFVKTGINLIDPSYYDMGVASISAVLKENGHETSFFYLEKWEMLPNLLNRIDVFNPDMIGFGSPSCNFEIFVKLSKIIKKRNSNIFLILGGYHPTLCPDESISMGSFDAISLGEGEYSILETVEKYKKTKKWYEGIKGMWFKIDGKIIKNPNRGMIENLDELPDPDWSIFVNEDCLFAPFDYGDGKRIEFMLSRGCPFDCAFCSNTAMRKFYGCTKIRYLSVDRSIDQIKKARKTYRMDYVIFDDDILTYDINWAKEFLAKYKKEIGLPFECNLRVGPFSSREMLILLKKAGCVDVKFGIETGNRDLRERVLNRKMTNEQIINTIQNAKSIGLRTTGNIMIGLPEETPQKFYDSIDLIVNSGLDKYLLYVFSPYVGTVLYNVCLEKGYISRKKINNFSERRDTVLNLPTFKREDILYFFDNLYQILQFRKPEKRLLKKYYRLLYYRLCLVYPSNFLYPFARVMLGCLKAPFLFFRSVVDVIRG